MAIAFLWDKYLVVMRRFELYLFLIVIPIFLPDLVLMLLPDALIILQESLISFSCLTSWA